MNRAFKASAPNVLWVADFTYVRTAVGFVYVAFIIDVFARYIVGWQVSSSPNTRLVLDALEQALAARSPDRDRLGFVARRKRKERLSRTLLFRKP